ncbi:hypothetical protein ACHAPU_010397, partial [Fusarium lateritium]
DTRPAHLTVFVQNITEAQKSEDLLPYKSFQAYRADGTPTVTHTIVTIRASAADPGHTAKHFPRDVEQHVAGIHSGQLELQLLVPGNLDETVERLFAYINKRKEQELLRDPPTPFFEYSSKEKVYTLGHAPAPGSDGFPTNDAGYQLMHFSNAEQHLIHNIASVVWDQAVQDQRTEDMATQAFHAVIIQAPHPHQDILVVKVNARDGVYPQSGDPCDVTIAGAVFEMTSDAYDEATLAVYQGLKAAEPQIDPLEPVD